MNHSERDPIVDAVRFKLSARSQLGLTKYGVSVAKADLNRREWLQHAQEEAMDLAVYLEKLILFEHSNAAGAAKVEEEDSRDKRSAPEAVHVRQKELYVASKVKHAAMWRGLRAGGVSVAATWIDEAGEGQTADYAELAARCISEITRSVALILYCEPGELLKGALIEVGVALAVGKRVMCVGDCDSISRVFKRHPLWVECQSVEEATKLILSEHGGKHLAAQVSPKPNQATCPKCDAKFNGTFQGHKCPYCKTEILTVSALPVQEEGEWTKEQDVDGQWHLVCNGRGFAEVGDEFTADAILKQYSARLAANETAEVSKDLGERGAV